MTQLKHRAEETVTRSGLGSLLPTHYHPIVATAGIVALILGITSVAIAVRAVMLIPEGSGTAGGATTVAAAPAESSESIDTQPVAAAPPEIERAAALPELTPKAQLPLAPTGDVNVSYAPEVPPHSGRTTQAIIDVHFEVVENVATIDPASSSRAQPTPRSSKR